MSLFASLQKVLPQHGLSRLAGSVAQSTTPWIKDSFINLFMRAYEVNLAEAEVSDPRQFDSFNAFFTRALKPGARTITSDPLAIACPADGAISQIGPIKDGTLLQAKGNRYSIDSLGQDLAHGFNGGSFFTVYLAPHNYHRLHLPYAGSLTATLAVPGALFSVNATTEEGIDGLFCRNERLVCRFETQFGPMLVVFVGAMIVGSIEAVWNQNPTPYSRNELKQFSDISFDKGDEIGRFLLGSTVICCFPKGAVALDETLVPGTPVEMGQSMGLTTS